mmetsp:Transcript_22702/g.64928  ORF Transcript_22702/g.64928 Transcript_22702/m.64928 type:complete len:209 (-) Transcript_22702:1824-2450(-)
MRPTPRAARACGASRHSSHKCSKSLSSLRSRRHRRSRRSRSHSNHSSPNSRRKRPRDRTLSVNSASSLSSRSSNPRRSDMRMPLSCCLPRPRLPVLRPLLATRPPHPPPSAEQSCGSASPAWLCPPCISSNKHTALRSFRGSSTTCRRASRASRRWPTSACRSTSVSPPMRAADPSTGLATSTGRSRRPCCWSTWACWRASTTMNSSM